MNATTQNNATEIELLVSEIAEFSAAAERLANLAEGYDDARCRQAAAWYKSEADRREVLLQAARAAAN